MTDLARAHLPTPLTSFVGREHDIAGVCALLQRDSARLVTLTGPGGVGKTRLALRVAQELQPAFEDGVAFVSLAAVTDPDLVCGMIAHALGVREPRERTALALLTDILRERNLLLVVDNFEQVVEAAPYLTELLMAAPGLRMLVTSRMVLRVSGEHDVPVRPLPLPDPQLPLLDQCNTEAVRLFVARARAADASFALTPDNAPDVAAICQRLDGLPLAIELVAAKVRYLPPHALLPRLATALPLLTGGRRDAPLRLQTLHNAIAWSYDLLPPAEQQLFRRLSVFAGGFTLDAAESVGDAGATSPSVLSLLESLVDKSMVEPAIDPRDDGRERFRMLETIREFGLERLAECGEAEAARWAHAQDVLAFTEQAAVRLYQVLDPSLLDQLAVEDGNARAALAWLARTGDEERCLRLAVAMGWYWYVRGFGNEGRSWLERARLPATPVTSATRAWALAWASALAHRQEDRHAAIALADQSVATWRELGDESLGIAMALLALGVAAQDTGDARAVPAYEEALARFRQLENRPRIANLLANLADVAIEQGDSATATALVQEALAMQRESTDTWGAALSQTLLGELTLRQHRPERALGHFRECVVLAWTLGDMNVLVDGLLGAAVGLAASGHRDRAVRWFSAVQSLHEAGNPGFYVTRFLGVRRDQAVETARTELGEAAFAAAWDAGLALPLAAFVDEVLAETGSVIAALATAGQTGAGGAGALTPREAEVLRLVAAGYANREIAERLFISVPTVKRHVSTILDKLDLPSRPAAVAFAHTHGLA